MAILRVQVPHAPVATSEESKNQQTPHSEVAAPEVGLNIPKIQKHFHVFYLNRLQFLGRVVEENKFLKAQKEGFQFKPQLNENSAAIAAKYRQKIVDYKSTVPTSVA
jgi:hypothetical protein